MSPSRHSEDEESVQLNQGQFKSQVNADESGPSAFMNPTFDQSTFIDSFNTLALQQKLNQRKNHKLYQILAQLTGKIDDMSTRTNVNGPSANNGEDKSSPIHDGKGEDVTSGGRSENDEDEDE